MIKAPVLFLIFNRIDVTRVSFNAIKAARPPRMYIASDGARSHVVGEQRLVDDVRQFVLSNIDWNCDVKTLFRQDNLGCRRAVSEAIGWFFTQEERGIVLEDDCVATKTFFTFCDELLEKYATDQRVWHIGGTSALSPTLEGQSYYFSKYSHIWGWASWRRAWMHYDVDMAKYSRVEVEDIVSDVTSDRRIRQIWKKNFDRAARKLVDTWDYQWYYCIWRNAGLSILPIINLVVNIGFAPDATHTRDPNNPLARLQCGEIPIVLHPERVARHKRLDDLNARRLFCPPFPLRVRAFLATIGRRIRRLSRG